jgi:hypothetical protein
MAQTPPGKLLLPSLLFFASFLGADSLGPWHVEPNQHRIVSRPKAIYEAGDAGVYVTCRDKSASFAIRERDPLTRVPEVKLQFGGSQSGMVASVGKDGVIRTFTFSRGTNVRDALASTKDSKEIIREMARHSRLAWIVDTDPDGFDSLEVRTSQLSGALHAIGCEP